VLAYNHSLQPAILNDNVNQFKVELESERVISHYKSQDNDVDVPRFLPAIVRVKRKQNDPTYLIQILMVYKRIKGITLCWNR
jgi:hypothetical protein